MKISLRKLALFNEMKYSFAFPIPFLGAMRRFLVHLRQDLHQVGHRSTEPGEGLRRHGSLPRKTW